MKTPSVNQQEGAKRARVMWNNPGDNGNGTVVLYSAKRHSDLSNIPAQTRKVLVVPVSALSEMEERVARAMIRALESADDTRFFEEVKGFTWDTAKIRARAALRALGLSQPAIRKGTKRGKSK